MLMSRPLPHVVLALLAMSCSLRKDISEQKDANNSLQNIPTDPQFHCYADYACMKGGRMVTGTIDSNKNFFATESSCEAYLTQQLKSSGCSNISYTDENAYQLETNAARGLVKIRGLMPYSNSRGEFIGKGVCILKVIPNRHAEFLKRVVRVWSAPYHDHIAFPNVFGIPDQSFLLGCEVRAAAPRTAPNGGCSFDVKRANGLRSFDIVGEDLWGSQKINASGGNTLDLDWNECTFYMANDVVTELD